MAPQNRVNGVNQTARVASDNPGIEEGHGRTRSARRDVEQAFEPLAQTLGLSFKQGETPDFSASGHCYIEQIGGGMFRAVQITDDGGTRPIFPTLPPTQAAELSRTYLAMSGLIPWLSTGQNVLRQPQGSSRTHGTPRPLAGSGSAKKPAGTK